MGKTKKNPRSIEFNDGPMIPKQVEAAIESMSKYMLHVKDGLFTNSEARRAIAYELAQATYHMSISNK